MSSNIRIERICELCGTAFIARTTVTRFCSARCNSRWGKIRIRKLKEQVSNQEVTQKVGQQNTLREKEFLSIIEAAQLLGISRMTLHRLIKKGSLSVKRFGRRVIISRSHLNQLFE